MDYEEKTIEKKLVEAVKEAGGIAPKLIYPGLSGLPDRFVLLPSGCMGLSKSRPPVRCCGLCRHRGEMLCLDPGMDRLRKRSSVKLWNRTSARGWCVIIWICCYR